MWLLQNRMIFAKFAGQSVSTDKKFSNRSKTFAVEDVTTNSWSTAITVPSEQKMVYKSLMETLVYQFNLTKKLKQNGRIRRNLLWSPRDQHVLRVSIEVWYQILKLLQHSHGRHLLVGYRHQDDQLRGQWQLLLPRQIPRRIQELPLSQVGIWQHNSHTTSVLDSELTTIYILSFWISVSKIKIFVMRKNKY